MSTAASPRSSDRFTGAAVVMGVAGCGKTTLGAALAVRLGVPFVEGDSLHSAESIAKMSAGIALGDEDRWPWLARIGASLNGEAGVIAACSALRKSYREAIARAAGRPVSFVFLQGPKPVLVARMLARKGHFMPPALLDSQFATLEPPGAGERHIALDLTGPPEALVAGAAEFLTGRNS